MKIPEISRVAQFTFSICVYWVGLYVNVVYVHIMREHFDYWEL
jgi:hypothetical protein